MKPVDQTILMGDGSGRAGDCFRACIASLLEMNIEDVPHFVEIYENNPELHKKPWLKVVNDWLKEIGYYYIEISYNGYHPGAFKAWAGIDEYYHILCGKSPRGCSHAVIGKNGKIFFDPHPSHEGFVNPEEEWTMGLILRVN
jgi:hypothetical protein